VILGLIFSADAGTTMVRDAAADDVVLRKRLLYVFKRFATTIGVDIVS